MLFDANAEPREARLPLLAKAGGMATAGMSAEPSAEANAEPRKARLPLLAKAGGMAAGASAEPSAEARGKAAAAGQSRRHGYSRYEH